MYKLRQISKYLLRKLRDINNYNAKKKIKKNIGLWFVLNDYLEKTAFTGCSFYDYCVLYDYIKTNRPNEVLECSTGVSTIVMAYAMMENEKDGYGVGRITSMEESREYCEAARRLLPQQISKFVEILHSPKVEDFYYFFRGVKYRDTPIREYDFVFIDGPTTSSPSDGKKTFDFDFIGVVNRSKKPVSAIIDCRISTCYVLNIVFGKNKIKFDKINNLGYVSGCTKFDLRNINSIVGAYGNLFFKDP